MTMFSPIKTTALRLAGPLLLALLCGCTQLDLSESLALPGSKPKPKIPERMVDVWSDTVLHQSGQRGVRGFGGRVMFYAKGNEVPVVVDGTFSVYAFDDSDLNDDPDTEPEADPDHQSPKKKYVFERTQLADHQSESELGPSYSFWIPWGGVGGPQKQITLISRFVDATGQVVVSKPSRHVLPGILPKKEGADMAAKKEAAAAKPDAGVRHASYDEPQTQQPAAPSSPSSAMATTTIELPPSFTRRLNAKASESESDPAAQQTPANAPDRGDSQTAAPQRSTDTEATDSAEKPPAAGQPKLETAAAGSPLTRSAPSRFPVRRERTVRPVSGRVRMQPHPATWPSALPRTPRAETSSESPAPSQAAAEAPN